MRVSFGNILKFIVLPLCGGLLTSVIGAAEAGPPQPLELTLPQAVAMALESNPALRAGNARVEAAAGRARQAGLWSNPELELTAEEWPVSNGRGFSDAKQTIGIAQTLPYPGKKSLERHIGRSGVRISEEELALRRTEIVRDVKAGFYKVLASEQLVALATQLVAVAESSARTTTKRVDAGATAYQEQLRAEVQLEQARTEQMSFQKDLADARHALGTLIGRPEIAEAKISGALDEKPEAELERSITNEQLDRHPSAAAARAGLEQARLESRRSRLEPYPDVTVGVAGGRLGDTDESIVELSVSVPLPLLDRGKGRRQETRANIAAAEAELEALRQELRREWGNASRRYEVAGRQVTSYRERVLAKAGEALRLVQVGYQEGKFTLIDLLDTQRTTAEAHLDYQRALLEMNIARAELEALLRPETIQPQNRN